ncbi:SusC/RagA family TonB-linked outer membrane protein [Empedobacter sedimenti]|uniref:SusC/RagA family TonB-linked outer membrane protein n=1 Tax=Empedobacter sedimenti TaxID=3042610 RepID=UPI0024A677F3|nr:SusC/RagA family TonB-linked outer membrane protein [Empedobacter sedimenti]
MRNKSKTLLGCIKLTTTVILLVGSQSALAQNTPEETKDSIQNQVHEIDEVVVIGYGTTKKKSVTGAVTSVKMKDLSAAANSNFAQALAGQAAGVTVMQSSGQPGAGINLRIRTNASNASGGVLYIVDGVVINDSAYDPSGNGNARSGLNFINPNDIETIDILKDASATAIYGARAAGGVVLITTKRGKLGKPTVQYDFSNSFQESIDWYTLLDTKDYMLQRNKILYEKWMYDNRQGVYATVPGKPTVSVYTPKYTDDQINKQAMLPSAIDAILRTGITEQHNISVAGAADKTRYLVSGNYFNQKGVLRGTDYRRYSVRMSLDQDLSSKIKVGANVVLTNELAKNGNIGTGQNETSGMIGAAFYHPANLPFKDENGNWIINPDYKNTPNPLSFLDVKDNTKSSRIMTSGYAEWKIISGLTAKALFSYTQDSRKRSYYQPKSFLFGARSEGSAGISQDSNETIQYDYTLNYAKTFGGKHNVNILIGHTYQLVDRNGFSAYNSKFPVEDFGYNDLDLGNAEKPTASSYADPYRIWKSYFARVTYEFDKKYVLSGTYRRDGASHFGPNAKWANFVGASGAWIISEEEFLKDSQTINLLKLRVGYGEVGNASFSGAYSYYSSGYNFNFGGINNTGVRLSTLGNPDLTWETQGESNAGLDFGLFKNRVSGSFDYYIRTFSNLLTSTPLPMDKQLGSIADNAGKTRSKGFEFNIKTLNIDTPDFTWSTNINFTHFNSHWVERSPASLKTLAKYIGLKDPFLVRYGYLSDGIYNPNTMTAPSWMPGILPGEVIIKDIDGYDANGNLMGKPDGKITSADMRIIMKNSETAPNTTFGIGNEFRYKNFDLSIFAYGAFMKKFNQDYAGNVNGHAKIGLFGWNLLDKTKDRWSYDNQTGKYPQALSGPYQNQGASSDFWVEDASFLRVRDITLGYTITNDMIKNQNVFNKVRIYVSAQNPFIITKYKGIDPELQNYYSYPIVKSIIMGANITF